MIDRLDGGQDTLEFGAEITAADVQVRVVGTDLVVGVAPAGGAALPFEQWADKVTLKDWTDPKNRIETFRFADGTTLNVAGIAGLQHTEGADTVTWIETALVLDGLGGNDVLTGGAYADTLSGGLDNDRLTGAGGNDTLDGGGGNDTLVGGDGADRLLGGFGNDTLTGDAGDDTYVFNRGDGQDTVADSAGSDALQFGAGITVADVQVRLVGGDLVVGVAPAGGGTLAFDQWPDKITLKTWTTPASRIETFRFADGTTLNVAGIAGLQHTESADTVTWTETALVLDGLGGNDVITSGAYADTLTGGLGNDTLSGGVGNDTLDGGAGNDTLRGGGGDDVFVVDNASDVVIENTSEGTDTVQTTLTSYTLGTNFEKLAYVGGGNFVGTGNTLNNVLTGGAGNDTLNGGTGSDTLYGGGGDDLYVVDVATDVVSEYASGGTDTVQTALTSYTLGAEVENLTFTGSAGFAGTGNVGKNVIKGAAGADMLQGLGGADTLDGSAGTDTATYAASTAAVWVDLAQGRGSGGDAHGDVLVNIENVVGSAFGDTLVGNSVANVLTGGSGADTLTGGAGVDTLIGGTGTDVYSFNAGDGADIVVNTSQVGDNDMVSFNNSIASNQLWFRHVGSDLEVSVIGTSDKLTISGWYSSANNHVGLITAGGSTLNHSSVEALVSAMSAFSPPPMGQTQLTQVQHNALDPLIAANWH